MGHSEAVGDISVPTPTSGNTLHIWQGAPAGTRHGWHPP